jgi:hypothetical protein
MLRVFTFRWYGLVVAGLIRLTVGTIVLGGNRQIPIYKCNEMVEVPSSRFFQTCLRCDCVSKAKEGRMVLQARDYKS